MERNKMKVMLTPPDLWGSTGYVAGAGAGPSAAGPGTSGGSDQVYKERGEMDIQWSICNTDSKETENILLVNRQRQVSDDRAICISYPRDWLFLK